MNEIEGLVRDAIGGLDMGPGITLRAALAAGMAQYYPDNHRGAQGCAEWALRQAAKRAIRAAQGTEAQRATTENTGVVHDGPVAKPCAQTLSGSTNDTET